MVESRFPELTGRILRTVSGDDMTMMVDLGVDDLFKRVRIRLHGVDTPSGFQAPPDSPGGVVRDQVRSLVDNKECKIRVLVQSKGGWIVDLFVPTSAGTEIHLNQHLRDQGHVFLRTRGAGKDERHV